MLGFLKNSRMHIPCLNLQVCLCQITQSATEEEKITNASHHSAMFLICRHEIISHTKLQILVKRKASWNNFASS